MNFIKKAHLILVFLLTLLIKLNAQITITDAQLPLPGDYYVEAVDTFMLYAISPGNGGTSQLWNFSTMISNDKQDSSFFRHPIQGKYSSAFPDANMLIDARKDPFVYAKNDSTGSYFLGWEWRYQPQGAPPFQYYDKPYKIIQLPANYQDSWTDTFSYSYKVDVNDTVQYTPFVIIVDSILYKNTSIVKDTIDGWGTITTADSNFNSIRQKNIVYEYDTGFVKTNISSNWTYAQSDYDVKTTWRWWTDKLRAPVAEIVDTNLVISNARYIKFTTGGLPIANFSAIGNGLQVNFQDASLNNPTSWFWDFNDGNNSMVQNPVNTYLTEGTYFVCLTVSNSKGTDQFCDSVNVVIPPPVANFAYIVDSLSIQFFDSSTGNPTSCFWDFGDGDTSLQTNPVHSYSNAGTFQVCLSCSNSSGSDTLCKTIDMKCPSDAKFFEVSYTAVTTCDSSTSDGMIQVDSITGSNSPFQLIWSNGATINQILNLLPGTYTATIIDAKGCKAIDSYKLICDQVWPGDVNDNLSVNHYDLFAIGLNYLTVGPSRLIANQNTLWFPYESEPWNLEQTNGADLKHADCNGDGVIDLNDIKGIKDNFGKVHAKSFSSSNSASNPDLYFDIQDGDIAPGSSVEVAIMAGRDTFSIYGIGFEVKIDMNLIEPGTMNIQWNNSWLGIAGVNLLTVDTIDETNGEIFGAAVRNNFNDTTAFGEIARIAFTVKNDSSIINSGFNLEITSSEGGVAATGGATNFNNSQDTVVVNPTSVKSDIYKSFSEIKIYPNPGKDIINIHHSTSQKIISIEIYEMTGSSVLKQENINNVTHSINTNGIDRGIYLLKVKTKNSEKWDKLVLN